MEFQKYSSIENKDRSKSVNQIIMEGFDNKEWVQTLKIHGGNYSIYINDNGIRHARRKGFIDSNNNDFYWGKNYDENVKRMWAFRQIPWARHMIVRGEVFGGMYNHPDVERDKHAKRFQKEVQYCPHNDFRAFDICIDGMYVDYDVFEYLCNKYEIPMAPLLARGSFKDLINNTVDFPDPLHNEFNLPSIENNIAEGWVMKPVAPGYLNNGDRVILKGKNIKFKEQNKEEKASRPSLELDDDANQLKDILFQYINENRLRNVLSHGIVVNDKMFGKILGEFAQDVLTDFLKDHSLEWGNTSEAQCRVIRKLMNKEAGDLIRIHWMDILDGEF